MIIWQSTKKLARTACGSRSVRTTGIQARSRTERANGLFRLNHDAIDAFAFHLDLNPCP
jgi:hypothetical protein